MEKLVKTRKAHMCWQCGEYIEKGETAILSKTKAPVYGKSERWDEDGPQIGIQYFTAYYHDKDGPKGDKCEADTLRSAMMI